MSRFLLSLAVLTTLCSLARAAPFVPKRDPQCVAVSPSGTMVATACSGMSDDTFPPRPHPDVRKCGVVAMGGSGCGRGQMSSGDMGFPVQIAEFRLQNEV